MATKNIKLDEETAIKLYKTASPELKTILEKNFDIAVLDPNPKNRIQTLVDVFSIVGVDPHKEVPFWGEANLNKRQLSSRADGIIKLITEAYNKLDPKPELDWTDRNQYKYFIYWERKAPGGWVLRGVGGDGWAAYLGAGHYFKSRENAEDAEKKFKDVWVDYLPA